MICIYIERERERDKGGVDQDTHLTHEFDKKVPQATQCGDRIEIEQG